MANPVQQQQMIQLPSFSEGWRQLRVTWETSHPLVRSCSYAGLYYAINIIVMRTLPNLEPSFARLVVDVIGDPVMQGAFRGIISNGMEAIQYHLRNEDQTPDEIDDETSRRVNIPALVHAAMSHHDKSWMLAFVRGRAVGFAFESEGFLAAVAIHAGEKLLPQLAPLLPYRVSELVCNIPAYYMFIFWDVLKKPILPLPSPLRTICDNSFKVVENSVTSVFRRVAGWFF